MTQPKPVAGPDIEPGPAPPQPELRAGERKP